MSDPCNPRWQVPSTDPALGPACDPAESLVESLGGVADDLRQIGVDLGMRPYRVFSVVVRWTGGEIGRGTPTSAEREFLPTPKLAEPSVNNEPKTGGLVERGSARLTAISPRYTEDEVRSLFGCDEEPGVETFVEVRVDARDGSTERRRFVVSGMPFREVDRFQWVAKLLRQDTDRRRNGSVPYVGEE